jgi:uridine kinase
MKKKKDVPPPIFSVKEVKADKYIIELENTDFIVANEFYTNFDAALDRVIDLNLLVRR